MSAANREEGLRTPRLVLFDEEVAWKEAMVHSRSQDELLGDAALLSSTIDFVNNKEDKCSKYSAQWWREWKAKTKVVRKRAPSAANNAATLKGGPPVALGVPQNEKRLVGGASFAKASARWPEPEKPSLSTLSVPALMRQVRPPVAPSSNSVSKATVNDGLADYAPRSRAKEDHHRRGTVAMEEKGEQECEPVKTRTKGRSRRSPAEARESREGSKASNLPSQGNTDNAGSSGENEAHVKKRPPRHAALPEIGRMPGGFIGNAPRDLSRAVSRSPGPIYEPVDSFSRPSLANVKFGSEARGGPTLSSGSGPDVQYHIPTSVGAGKAAFVNTRAMRPWDAEARKARLHNEASAEIAKERSGAEAAPIDSDSEDLHVRKEFGFGCSLEEHIQYGECLDGLCGKRSHLEKVSNKAAKRAAAKRAKDKPVEQGASLAFTATSGAFEDERRKTALHAACEQNHLDVVHRLLLRGAPISVADKSGWSPLAYACDAGHVRVVQRLLANAQYPHVSPQGYVTRRRPPRVNVTDDRGQTPLHRAATNGHASIVALLLEAGANADVLDRDNCTALDVCTSPPSFHLLRHRAEVYNRRERFEGVELKRSLIEGEAEEQVRAEQEARAAVLNRETRAITKANDVVKERVRRVDRDILNYKAKGELLLDTNLVQRESSVAGQNLVKLCLENDTKTPVEIIDAIGVSSDEKG